MLSFAAPLLLLLPLTAYAAEYRVGVGKDETNGQLGIGFDPSSIRPTGGDHIIFEFRAGAHSAVQTTFENPCQPMPGGYDSGVFIVPAGTLVDAPGLPTSQFDIKSADPLWFYDGASGQCHLGAVFSVNPPISGSQTAALFLEAAKKTTPQPATTVIPSTTAPPAASSQAPQTNSTGTGAGATTTSQAPSQSTKSASGASGVLQNANAAIAVTVLAGFGVIGSLALM